MTPSAEDLKSWADNYGLTLPVIADEGWALNSRFEQDNGIPTVTLIGPGMEVIAVDSWEAESMIEDVLPN